MRQKKFFLGTLRVRGKKPWQGYQKNFPPRSDHDLKLTPCDIQKKTLSREFIHVILWLQRKKQGLGFFVVPIVSPFKMHLCRSFFL